MMHMGESQDPMIIDGFKANAKRKFLILLVLVGAVLFAIGVVIGYFGKKTPTSTAEDKCPEGPCLGPHVPDSINQDGDPSITQKIIDGIKADNIRENLR